MNDYTTFLFARPSQAEAVGRIIDIGGFMTEFNRSLTPEQADNIALRMDWKAASSYLWRAIIDYEREKQKSKGGTTQNVE